MANDRNSLADNESMPQAFGELVQKVFPTAIDETISDIESLF